MQLRFLEHGVKHLRRKTRIRGLLLPIAFGTIASIGTPSLAQTLPNSQYYTAQVYGQRIGVNGGPFAAEGMGATAQSRTVSGTDWFGSASSDETFGGYVAAQATIRIPATTEETYTAQLYAESTLHYLFYVDGPSANALIPVVLLGSGNVSSYGNPGVASAGLDFFHDGISSNWTATRYANQSGQSGFAVNELFYLQVGHSYSLTTFAEASAIRSNIDSDDRMGSASASVDPTFTIQGEFGSQYHFVGLPPSAIGAPVAMVPEPETWALLTLGVGFLGLAKRRRYGR